VIFVESLPHTATGKLLKTELRAKYGGQFAVAG
jgi:acyl-CoA synthetase (AMP-forming)/AMP-acid ligase II